MLILPWLLMCSKIPNIFQYIKCVLKTRLIKLITNYPHLNCYLSQANPPALRPSLLIVQYFNYDIRGEQVAHFSSARLSS